MPWTEQACQLYTEEIITLNMIISAYQSVFTRKVKFTAVTDKYGQIIHYNRFLRLWFVSVHLYLQELRCLGQVYAFACTDGVCKANGTKQTRLWKKNGPIGFISAKLHDEVS